MLLLISSQINVKSFNFMDFNFHGFVYLIHLLENNIAQLQNKTFKCSLCIFTYSFFSWKNYHLWTFMFVYCHLWTFMFVYCHLPITYFTPVVLVGVRVAHVVLWLFLCPSMCLYVLSLCCVLSHVFRIKTMSGSSLPQVVCFIYVN